MECPHCGVPYGEKAHVCSDHDRWTRKERDEWRAWARRESPSITFVDTYVMDRFGGPRTRREP